VVSSTDDNKDHDARDIENEPERCGASYGVHARGTVLLVNGLTPRLLCTAFTVQTSS
jgi:hypothetical protein